MRKDRQWSGVLLKGHIIKAADSVCESAAFILYFLSIYSSTTEKSSLPTPQSGHTQSSGMSSKAVLGSMPLSGSPVAGS